MRVLFDLKHLTTLLAISIIAACTSHGGGVSATQTDCCLPDTPAVYDLGSIEVPGFMQDMVEVSLHMTMQTLGHTHRRSGEADLFVSAYYQQLNVEAENPERPAMAEATVSSETTQFLARINITIVNQLGQTIWQGHVQRAHDVGPGEYMHRGNAANYMAQALVDLINEDANR